MVWKTNTLYDLSFINYDGQIYSIRRSSKYVACKTSEKDVTGSLKIYGSRGDETCKFKFVNKSQGKDVEPVISGETYFIYDDENNVFGSCSQFTSNEGPIIGGFKDTLPIPVTFFITSGVNSSGEYIKGFSLQFENGSYPVAGKNSLSFSGGGSSPLIFINSNWKLPKYNTKAWLIISGVLLFSIILVFLSFWAMNREYKGGLQKRFSLPFLPRGGSTLQFVLVTIIIIVLLLLIAGKTYVYVNNYSSNTLTESE